MASNATQVGPGRASVVGDVVQWFGCGPVYAARLNNYPHHRFVVDPHSNARFVNLLIRRCQLLGFLGLLSDTVFGDNQILKDGENEQPTVVAPVIGLCHVLLALAWVGVAPRPWQRPVIGKSSSMVPSLADSRPHHPPTHC